MAGSTARSAADLNEFRHSFSGRIASLARTHAIITEDASQMASLHDLLKNELTRFAETSARRVSLEGPDVMLPSHIAIPLGMTIHELTANSVKYGALSRTTGRVAVAWKPEKQEGFERLQLDWVEQGGPPVREPSSRGFGFKVLERVLKGQVGARVTSNFRPSGLQVHMDIPLVSRRANLPGAHFDDERATSESQIGWCGP